MHKARSQNKLVLASDVLLALTLGGRAVEAGVYRDCRFSCDDSERVRFAGEVVRVVREYFAGGGVPCLTDGRLALVLRGCLPEMSELGARRAAVALRESVQRVLARSDSRGSA